MKNKKFKGMLIALISVTSLFGNVKDWGPEQNGTKTWVQAVELCKGIRQRLPTFSELEDAFKDGTHKELKHHPHFQQMYYDGKPLLVDYWSSDSCTKDSGEEGALAFSLHDGKKNCWKKNYHQSLALVRCHK